MAETKKTTVQDLKQEKAEKSKKNKLNGGENVVIPLNEIVNVRFTKDHGKMKKGQTARLSKFAFEVYDKNKCVEKIN